MHPLSNSPKPVARATGAELPLLFPLAPGYTHDVHAEAAWHLGASRDPRRDKNTQAMHKALWSLLSARADPKQVPEWVKLAWAGYGRMRPHPFNLRKKQ